MKQPLFSSQLHLLGRPAPIQSSLRTAHSFPVVASLPPKNSVCEPERQNDFRDVKPFVLMLVYQIKG